MGRPVIDATRRLILVVLLAQCAIASGLGAVARAQVVSPSPSPSRVEHPAAVRDLAADERMGGHTLARHVGKSDADLAARLRREPNISAASTYTSVEIASAAVGTALQQQSRRLESWLARSGARPNLVLNYVQTTGPPLGRALARGARTAVPCQAALVVIRWDERRGSWFVLTSYPEVRR